MRGKSKVAGGCLRAAVEDAYAGFPSRGGGAVRRAARAQLAHVLWTPHGARKVAGARALDDALEVVSPADLAWIVEFSPLAPLYFLPTRRFVVALAKAIDGLGARRVLEVAAGDGLLARALATAAPHLDVIASDSGAWEQPAARMSERERARYRDRAVPGLALGSDVHRLAASTAIRRFAPDLVLAAWLPPTSLLDRLVRAPVRHVLEIGAGEGITASAYSWRFAHEFLEGPIEQLARCRLDDRPSQKTHSRITLYYGKAHPEHVEERVRPGDWLWQFRPRRTGSELGS
jgi:hypothetical protein